MKCRRCGGRIIIDFDEYGPDVRCLNCGQTPINNKDKEMINSLYLPKRSKIIAAVSGAYAGGVMCKSLHYAKRVAGKESGQNRPANKE